MLVAGTRRTAAASLRWIVLRSRAPTARSGLAGRVAVVGTVLMVPPVVVGCLVRQSLNASRPPLSGAVPLRPGGCPAGPGGSSLSAGVRARHHGVMAKGRITLADGALVLCVLL